MTINHIRVIYTHIFETEVFIVNLNRPYVNLPMKFGSILKELRKIKGVNQQQIAEKLNIERSTYSKWETDKIVIRVDQLKNLAAIYGLDFEFMSRCVEAGKVLSRNDVERFIRMQEEKEKHLKGSIAN